MRSFASGASSWQPGHPVAGDSPRRVNWRWSLPLRPGHRARTPGRPVCAVLGHVTSRARTHSKHFTACRAAPLCAPISKYANGPSYVDQPSRSKLALSRKSLSNVAILDIWISQGKPDELEILTTDTLLYGGFFGRKATRTIDSSGVMLDRYFQPLSWKRG